MRQRTAQNLRTAT